MEACWRARKPVIMGPVDEKRSQQGGKQHLGMNYPAEPERSEQTGGVTF